MNHRLLGRHVTLEPGLFVANDELTKHMEGGGTIEAVYYEKDARYGNGYRVLVRNPQGKTMEIGLNFLVLAEML